MYLFNTDVSSICLQKSKERVFGNEKEGKTNEGEMSATLRLEESPKWHLLSLVLEEIEKEHKERIKEEGEDRNIVLIVANDYRTCSQLKQVSEGGQDSGIAITKPVYQN